MLETLRKDADIIIKNAIESSLPDSAVKKALEKFPFPKLFYWDKPDKPDVQGASSRLYAISSRPSPPGEPFFHGLPCWGGHHRCTIFVPAERLL